MKKIVIFSGSGISKESGIPTYRDGSDSVWSKIDPMKYATKEAWKNNREGVLDYLNKTRELVKNAIPNKAHYLIGDLQNHFEVSVITQNVDDLHERGGSTKVLHLHGNINVNRSTLKPKLKYHSNYEPISLGDKCDYNSQLRHDVVLFGEYLDEVVLNESLDLVKEADILIIIGTSLTVSPARLLPSYTKADTLIYLIDPNEVDLKVHNFKHLKTQATNGMSEVYDELLSFKK